MHAPRPAPPPQPPLEMSQQVGYEAAPAELPPARFTRGGGAAANREDAAAKQKLLALAASGAARQRSGGRSRQDPLSQFELQL